LARLPVDEGVDCLSAWHRRLTSGTAFATIKTTGKSARTWSQWIWHPAICSAVRLNYR